MMTCQQITTLVTDYIEGSMPWRQRIQFRLHVGLCVSCHRYLKQMKQTITALGKMPEEPIPKNVRAELVKRFQSWQHEHGSRTKTP